MHLRNAGLLSGSPNHYEDDEAWKGAEYVNNSFPIGTIYLFLLIWAHDFAPPKIIRKQYMYFLMTFILETTTSME